MKIAQYHVRSTNLVDTVSEDMANRITMSAELRQRLGISPADPPPWLGFRNYPRAVEGNTQAQDPPAGVRDADERAVNTGSENNEAGMGGTSQVPMYESMHVHRYRGAATDSDDDIVFMGSTGPECIDLLDSASSGEEPTEPVAQQGICPANLPAQQLQQQLVMADTERERQAAVERQRVEREQREAAERVEKEKQAEAVRERVQKEAVRQEREKREREKKEAAERERVRKEDTACREREQREREQKEAAERERVRKEEAARQEREQMEREQKAAAQCERVQNEAAALERVEGRDKERGEKQRNFPPERERNRADAEKAEAALHSSKKRELEEETERNSGMRAREEGRDTVRRDKVAREDKDEASRYHTSQPERRDRDATHEAQRASRHEAGFSARKRKRANVSDDPERELKEADTRYQKQGEGRRGDAGFIRPSTEKVRRSDKQSDAAGFLPRVQPDRSHRAQVGGTEAQGFVKGQRRPEPTQKNGALPDPVPHAQEQPWQLNKMRAAHDSAKSTVLQNGPDNPSQQPRATAAAQAQAVSGKKEAEIASGVSQHLNQHSSRVQPNKHALEKPIKRAIGKWYPPKERVPGPDCRYIVSGYNAECAVVPQNTVPKSLLDDPPFIPKDFVDSVFSIGPLSSYYKQFFFSRAQQQKA